MSTLFKKSTPKCASILQIILRDIQGAQWGFIVSPKRILSNLKPIKTFILASQGIRNLMPAQRSLQQTPNTLKVIVVLTDVSRMHMV